MTPNYPVSEVIGHKIKVLRRARGLSLFNVAKEIGISEQQQLRYERGTNRMSLDRLKQYADFFETSFVFFFLFNQSDKEKIKTKFKVINRGIEKANTSDNV